ncbi:MAG: late competence development protein ComFB [Idiomarinaceae bacterium HL-53]|nr:MAG: late competence development protein ComFB [Idiomarinaceae bacterium HL-53]CUS49466.1 Late competence development protein ComFB [Idiomarinaceae bacterium HL-53]
MKLNDDIHNYYEHLVVDHIQALGLHQRFDDEFLADLCCLVLNQLPPRYIRYEVDMAFFLSADKRMEMDMQVQDAVDKGVKFLEKRRADERDAKD